MQFDIQPNRGALPILFGMTPKEVHRILGKPLSTRATYKNLGTNDTYQSICIGYDPSGRVNHIGFSPAGIELSIEGAKLWDAEEQPDPIPTFLALDPEPIEKSGFWYFTKLGVTTTGFHDDDPSQRAVTMQSADNPELAVFARGVKADTSKYKTRRKKPKK